MSPSWCDSRQQTFPILVTKNCFLYWDQQTFRKIREISADFMSPIVATTNFFSVLYWSQKTQNNKVIVICCEIIIQISQQSELKFFISKSKVYLVFQRILMPWTLLTCHAIAWIIYCKQLLSFHCKDYIEMPLLMINPILMYKSSTQQF